MNGLETEFNGKISFYQLNADQPENAQLLQTYGLRGHPSVAILDQDGQVVQRYFGAETAEALRSVLNRLVPQTP